MELNSNPEDGRYGSAKSALPVCENPALCSVTAVQSVTNSKNVDSSAMTDLACDIDHSSSPLSAFMPDSALSLDEAASFQPVGKVKSLREWPHAEPIPTNSISGVRSAQDRRVLQNGLLAAAPLIMKVSCVWADESGMGSS